MNKKRYYLIIGLIATAFVLGCIENSNSGAQLEIRKIDVKGHYYLMNITIEELNQYPALENAINGEDCTEYIGYTRCNTNIDDWNNIKDFIDSKKINDKAGIRDTCFKFGEKYGDACYTIGFVTSSTTAP